MKSAIENPEITLTRGIQNRIANLIKTKSGVYKLYEVGIFGNKALTWNSYEEILKSDWKGLVCMRSKKGIDRKSVVYNLSIEEIPKYIQKWKQKGIPENAIHFNQSMPDEHLTIQGEITRAEYKFCDGLGLRYSTIKKPMNQALAEENIEVEKAEAFNLIKKNMDFKSFSNLENLIETWPECVVEFASYNIPVGNLGWNTVFWEVRNY